MVESNALAKRNDYGTEKEKETYDENVAETKNEINTLNKTIEYDKLTYNFKIPISFNAFNCPLGLIRKIKDGSIYLQKENQEKFRTNLSETLRVKWEHQSKEKKI